MDLASKRRTKVIWSFDSQVLNETLARNVVNEDFDCLRLVYQPQSATQIIQFLDAIEQARKPEQIIPIMIDIPLQVRAVVSKETESRELGYGETIILSANGGENALKVEVADWKNFFKEGSTIYCGYGNITLQTVKVKANQVEAQVIQGGTVYPGMEMHVPETRTDPQLSQIDTEDFKKLLTRDIDYFVLPGFSSPAALIEMKQFIKQHSRQEPWFILSLNTQKIYQNLESFLEHVHGVLISRVEMALTMEPAIIPVITKEVIQMCGHQAKVAFTASEMLGSMRMNATPTRAEVSDIANAVIDGTDAVVLTEDIAYGEHASKAIQLMVKIVEDVEQRHGLTPNWQRQDPDVLVEMDAVAFSAYKTATRVGAKAIVCLTREGNTAVKLASFRPHHPIVAVTFSHDVCRKLSLVRGVSAYQLDADPVVDQVLPVVNDLLKKSAALSARDRIVFVSVTLSPLSQTESNLLTVQTIS